MNLKVSIVQYDIEWEDKTANLNKIEKYVSALSDKTDLVILPEMCTTGFSMNVQNLAETIDGNSINYIKRLASKYNLAICGSLIIKEENKFYNRGFFITPQDEYYYDKRHLFRMGEETHFYEAGNKHLIIEHKGFNICLLICYDIRFPVWARNINNEYDLLIYVANWPESRVKTWEALLKARAIENMAYVCGVNRIGRDGLNINYNGTSMIIDARGNILSSIETRKEQIETQELSLTELNAFRNKFPVWKDADRFELKY